MEVTKEIEASKYPSLNSVVPLYNTLKNRVEDWVEPPPNPSSTMEVPEGALRPQHPEITIRAATIAKEKLIDYYGKTTDVCLIALMLDPRIKLNYFSVEGWGGPLESEIKTT